MHPRKSRKSRKRAVNGSRRVHGSQRAPCLGAQTVLSAAAGLARLFGCVLEAADKNSRHLFLLLARFFIDLQPPSAAKCSGS